MESQPRREAEGRGERAPPVALVGRRAGVADFLSSLGAALLGAGRSLATLHRLGVLPVWLLRPWPMAATRGS